MKLLNKKILLCVTAFLISGCSSSGDGDNSNISIEVLKSAPEKIKIAGNEYVIETYLWRDLMPVIDPKDIKGLTANVKLISSGGKIPESIKKFPVVARREIFRFSS